MFSLNDVNCLATRPTGRANTHQVLADAVEWWVEEDLNLRPHAYQACALTT